MKDFEKRLHKILGKEQARVKGLFFPMDKDNVTICLQNLVVEIKKEFAKQEKKK